MCSDNWVGSDCSVPRDSNSLVWETLLDTQLTVVRDMLQSPGVIIFNCSGEAVTH